jgi:translation initiation factor 2B subunit (eIF-2B alpha/beta/delta family)/8-oxo-dGTP pyrophosphatase MutT (NUDIX family)
MQLRHVVTCFLVRPDDGRVLLGERSEDVRTYPGHWAAISGSVEEAGPLEQAYREIEEEAGLVRSDVQLRSEGWPVRFTDWDLGTVWVVHPYRFRCDAPERVRRDWEHIRFDWVEPERIRDLQTVPKLAEAWESADRQDGRPDPDWIFERVREDRDHGADELGIWTLMGLKRTGEALSEDDDWRESFRKACRRTQSLRSSMAPVIAAGLDAWMRTSEAESPRQLVGKLDKLTAEREQAPFRAAEAAAERIPDGAQVVTLSYSFSVLATLYEAAERVGRLTVAESRPACEGRRTVELAASFGIETELVTDAVAAGTARDADLVLTGADSLMPDGAVVNKSGTFALCCAAARGAARAMVAASESKVLPAGHEPEMEEMDPGELGESIPGVDARNVYFETIPADLIDEIVTEQGLTRPDTLAHRARRLKEARDSLL